MMKNELALYSKEELEQHRRTSGKSVRGGVLSGISTGKACCLVTARSTLRCGTTPMPGQPIKPPLT